MRNFYSIGLLVFAFSNIASALPNSGACVEGDSRPACEIYSQNVICGKVSSVTPSSDGMSAPLPEFTLTLTDGRFFKLQTEDLNQSSGNFCVSGSWVYQDTFEAKAFKAF